MDNEPAAVAERYAARSVGDLYSMLRPDVWMPSQERDREILQMLRTRVGRPLSELRLVEVGCGYGANLLEMLRFGFDAKNVIGIELLPERAERARERLPGRVELRIGDASEERFAPGSIDLVYASLVFSSLLDPDFRSKLASRIWEWIRPGGALLWYDFTYDNPANADVAGIGRREIERLFPDARMHCRRVTLAPPIARRVAPIHPSLYTVFNLIPWLRTHLLCWIEKCRE